MARWKWSIGTLAGGPVRELTGASGRRLTFRADAAADAQFSLRGDSADLATMIRLATDLFIWLDNVKVFQGRIVVDAGNIGPNSHTVQFSALDYRAMLNRRIIGAGGLAYTTLTDQAAIVWGMIATSQALPGGDWTITNGLGSTSAQQRTGTWDPGKPLGDAIAELGRLDNGFEWQIGPDLTFDRWYPQRGTDNGLQLDFGGLISQVGYGFSGDDFANAGLVTGDQLTVPSSFATADVATDLRGRWEKAQSFPTIDRQATLDARGAWYRDQVSQVRPDYRMTFTAGRWPGRAACWVGDTVYPWIKSGWIQKHGVAHRITELQMVPDDADGETVTVGLLATGTSTDDLTPWGGPTGHGGTSSGSSITTESGNALVTESGDSIVWS